MKTMTRLMMLLALLLVVLPAQAQEEAPDADRDAAPAPDAQEAEHVPQTDTPDEAEAPDAAALSAPAPVQEAAPAPRPELRGTLSLAPAADAQAVPTEPAEPEPAAKPARAVGDWLKFKGVFQTVLLYQNDSDFDGTPPYYDVHGQSVGLLGTFFKPRLEILPIDELSIVWEMELGLNLWSRHNPDQYASGEFDTFRLAQRELYLKGEFMEGALGFAVGYQHLTDATGLFINHWVGAGSFTSRREWASFSFTVAQLPDQTFEGVTLSSNNFRHDTFVYGFQVDVPISQWLVAIGLWGLHDNQIVDQSLNLFTPGLHISADYDWARFGVETALQVGANQNGAVDGDERTLAWALQAFAQFDVENLGIGLNQLVLSADDRHNRNSTNKGFYYSGKNRSRTLLLTENGIRDVGGNLDEAVSEPRGEFYVTRPGLSVTDLTLSYNIGGFFIPAVVVGLGFVLEPENALGGKMIGVETDLDLEFVYRDLLSFHLIGGLLMPGKAGAALVNTYDREATRTQYMFLTSVSVSF